MKYQLLQNIASPTDVRRLSRLELKQLAAEVRDFVVQSVAQTGGHLTENGGEGCRIGRGKRLPHGRQGRKLALQLFQGLFQPGDGLLFEHRSFQLAAISFQPFPASTPTTRLAER